jgi:hypothetical protein
MIADSLQQKRRTLGGWDMKCSIPDSGFYFPLTQRVCTGSARALSFTGGKAAGVKVTHSPPLKCMLRLREAIPPLLHTSSWFGTQSICTQATF